MIKELFNINISLQFIRKFIFLFSFLTTASFAEAKYEMSISNSGLINDNIYEFDIYIQSLNGSFILTSYQSVFSFNQDIINNGELTFTFIGGTSELQNIPSTGFGINGTDGSLELTFASLPDAESIGTEPKRVGRFRIVNTNSFGSNNINLRWDFDGVITTILTGESFVNITNSGYHKNESSTGTNNNSDQPQYFELSQNYPNPFNPSTKIQFSLPEDSKVKLTLFNILGEEVDELVNGEMNRGVHTITFNADDLTSGVYLYKLDVENQFTDVRKMILMK